MAKGIIWHNRNKGLVLVTRSGSHTLFKTILEQFYPNNYQGEQVFVHENDRWHPVMNLSDIHDLNNFDIGNTEYAVMVRNPLDRFRSSCARVGCSVEEGLNMISDNVHFWTMKSMGILDSSHVKYFLFPNQLDECAQYLGLNLPLPVLNSEDEDKKPIINEENLIKIKEAYSSDIAIYEELLNANRV
jgi:hypothetical protein